MSEQNIEETQPTTPEINQESNPNPAPAPKKSKNWTWIVGGLLAIILIGAAGALGGYYAGIADRQAVEKNQTDITTSMQYQLGMADLEAGRLDMAKQRFEYVIQLNPAYPGVLENMARLTIIMNATSTPTVMPSPTAAPTLDLSGVEALLVQAKQLLAASDYNGTLTALDMLRKQNVSFQTFEVDGLYYHTLSKRGIQKISNGDLEAGIYDFAVMKRFGPQDKESKDIEEYAKLYISAGRYFGWDWENAVKYFGDLNQYVPTLMDTSHRSVADRYRESLAKYGDVLAGKDKWCQAVPYYEQSLAIGTDNKVNEAYGKAFNKCQASLPTSTPTIDPAAITPDVVVTTEVPVVEEPTAVPTDVPTVPVDPPATTP